MRRLIVLLLVSVSIAHGAAYSVPSTVDSIDWTRVKPVEELDHYWARLPPELQAYRNGTHGTHPSGRITNGLEARVGQFPYQALLLTEFGMFTIMCGGTVLTPNFILTAAHCVMLDQTTKATGGMAILGAHNRMVVESTQQRIRFATSGIIVHPSYTATNFRFDVAMVRLNAPLRFNSYVQPVRLPARTDQRLFDGIIGTVSGFGRTNDKDGILPSILRYTINTILSNGACAARWGSLLVEPHNICLSGDGGRSACVGDSGGPLTIEEWGGITYQVGVTSFGSGNGCTDGMPTVYGRVSYFLDWIKANSDCIAC
ncbi:AGAP007251-PA [Anopheles gambiae str. PEST]|uniref:AGAP007251-PA n=1 Tax=Anopheles gambiae TaxID=7165 RepID=Q7QJ44_ANOGA|nr:AGAP007251-PA [Anopheles gambiae str. PEST]